jgi:hypothetical protein
MNEQNLAELNVLYNEADVRKICVYFIIVASIMYLILYNQTEAKIIDKELGTNYESTYPNTENFSKIIAIIFLIVNSIFLYYSFVDLGIAKESQQKTGIPASLEPNYLFILVNTLQFAAIIIAVYNVFANDFGRVGITR